MDNNVDFYALSFVKDANVIRTLKDFLKKNNGAHIKVLAKIESADSVNHLEEILEASDGGCLGSELRTEKKSRCRQPRLVSFFLKK